MRSIVDRLLRVARQAHETFSSLVGAWSYPAMEPTEIVYEHVLGFRLLPMYGTGGELILTDRRLAYVPMDLKLTYWLTRRHAVDIPLGDIKAFGERHPLHRLRGHWLLPVWFVQTDDGKTYTFQSQEGRRLLSRLNALTNGVHA